KDHIAAWFGCRGLEKTGAGGLYLSVNHKGIDVAGGVYHPEPQTMLTVRTHIAGTHEEFRRLLAHKKLCKIMGDLRGDELTRMPKGFGANHPAADLIRKKDWILFATLEPSFATDSKLLCEII